MLINIRRSPGACCLRPGGAQLGAVLNGALLGASGDVGGGRGHDRLGHDDDHSGRGLVMGVGVEIPRPMRVRAQVLGGDFFAIVHVPVRHLTLLF